MNFSDLSRIGRADRRFPPSSPPCLSPPWKPRLDHRFGDPARSEQALTHRKVTARGHNERLEFLRRFGAELRHGSHAVRECGKLDEGDLSRLRANLVKQASLVDVARRLDLSQHLRLSEGELKSGGFRRPSIPARRGRGHLRRHLPGRRASTRLRRDHLPQALPAGDGDRRPKTLGKDAKTLPAGILQGRKLPLPRLYGGGHARRGHSQQFEVEWCHPGARDQGRSRPACARPSCWTPAGGPRRPRRPARPAPRRARSGKARKTAQLSLPVAGGARGEMSSTTRQNPPGRPRHNASGAAPFRTGHRRRGPAQRGQVHPDQR